MEVGFCIWYFNGDEMFGGEEDGETLTDGTFNEEDETEGFFVLSTGLGYWYVGLLFLTLGGGSTPSAQNND